MAEVAAQKLVYVKTSDNDEEFAFPYKYAEKMGTILNVVDEFDKDDEKTVIPLGSYVTSDLFRVVLQYAKYHDENPDKECDSVTRTDDLCDFDKALIPQDTKTRFDLIVMANYLEYPSFMYMVQKVVSNTIKAMSPSECVRRFNLTNATAS